MSNNIKLNFINKSNDVNNSSVVIFQKNIADNFDKPTTAWKVIHKPKSMDNHPIDYTTNFQIATSDSHGNNTPKLTAHNGSAFEVVENTTGDVLQNSSTPAMNLEEIEVRNNLTRGAINANCYRNGKLLASKINVSPGQKAVFKFNPSIYIGTASEIEEGEFLNSAIISQINTEINLLGINSADIVMTGGGSEPFKFSLENVR
ncbi:Aromatic ring-opening dioxygenase LigA [Tenacibaculum sediminilitoris]|uniref:hypothetical protein n=1 Tax=Tenacibaculum sediminilitoris TaxID=1820334 RepID=UPI003894C175